MKVLLTSVSGVSISSSDGDSLAVVVDLALFRFNVVVENLASTSVGYSHSTVASDCVFGICGFRMFKYLACIPLVFKYLILFIPTLFHR